MARKGESAVLDWLRAHLDYVSDGCLIWPFSKNWNGYGHVSYEGLIQYAHRVMCRLKNGPPPDSKHVAAHTCNNGQGGCIHPLHLCWKTPHENLMDRRAAGTITKKRWHNKGLLSDETIDFIRLLKPYANQRELAALFGISYQHVSVIQQGKLKSQRRRAGG